MTAADDGLFVDIHDLLLGAMALIDRSEHRDRDDDLLAARSLVRIALDRTVDAQNRIDNP